MLKLSKSFTPYLVAVMGFLVSAQPGFANQHSLPLSSTVQPEVCGAASAKLVAPASTPFLINVGDAGVAGLHMTFNNAPLGVLKGSITTSDLSDIGIAALVTFTDGTTANIPHVQGLSAIANTAAGQTAAGETAQLTIDLTEQGYPAGATITNIDFGVYNQNNPNNITVYMDQPTYQAVPITKIPNSVSCNFR